MVRGESHRLVRSETIDPRSPRARTLQNMNRTGTVRLNTELSDSDSDSDVDLRAVGESPIARPAIASLSSVKRTIEHLDDDSELESLLALVKRRKEEIEEERVTPAKCSVCLNTWEDDPEIQMVVANGECTHYVCFGCLMKLLENHFSPCCPVCKEMWRCISDFKLVKPFATEKDVKDKLK